MVSFRQVEPYTMELLLVNEFSNAIPIEMIELTITILSAYLVQCIAFALVSTFRCIWPTKREHEGEHEQDLEREWESELESEREHEREWKRKLEL